MKSVLLRLEGPLQGWSTQIKLGVRDTDREPSKSGVIGLVGAALGMERGDERMLSELARLTVAIRVDRAGILLRDYHTAGGGLFRGKRYLVFDAKDCVPSHRYYLADASFVASLSGDAALIDRIAVALHSPRWPLFLGRRACVPSVPPFIDLADGEAATTVRAAPPAERVDSGPLRLLVESAPGEGEPRYDVPLSFAEGARRYGLRYVRTEWLDIAGRGTQPSEAVAHA